MLKHVFSPGMIGKMEIPNRLVVPAMVMNFCNEDGSATERYIAYHEEKAKGGWGLIITEDYAVDPKGKGFTNIAGLWDDSQIEGHAQLTAKVHQHGGKIVAQIYHAGRQTNHFVIGSQPLAPSPIPCPVNQEIPHELTIDEIYELVDKFGECALRAQKAGFDGIELHGAHGYLIAQFMSPYSNKRVDEYGGNILNRMRFPLEIIANIRNRVGKDFPIIFRISADEFVTGGRTIEDTKVIARFLEDSGIDAINVSSGVYGSKRIGAPAFVPHGWMTDFAAEVKKVVSIPVITVGRINDPFLADSILASGKADFVAMGRASLADPALPNKALAGRFEDINHCIGCMQACSGNIAKAKPGGCLVNPHTGKEYQYQIKPAANSQKVFVAGGGPAGMEAAIIAAQRGHQVHLYEKTDRLGGQFTLAAVPPGKGEIAEFIVWQANQLRKNSVNVHLNCELTSAMVEKDRPNVVIVATGSRPLIPDLPGNDRPHVVSAHDVLAGKAYVGKRAIVIGGGMVGSETASHLANHGKEVIIVEALPEIALDEERDIRNLLIQDLGERNVRIYVNTLVKEIMEDGIIASVNGKDEKIGPADTIIFAVGLESANELRSRLEKQVEKVITIGDAVKARKALEAIEEGFLAGLEI